MQVPQDRRGIVVLWDHDEKANMDDVVSLLQVFEDLVADDVKLLQRDVGGEPSLVGLLVYRDIEAVQLDGRTQLTAEIDEPDALHILALGRLWHHTARLLIK